MAGTIPLSLTQQFDEFGQPLSGGLLYIYQAGTVATPQQPYQDYGLTILQPNPIPLDAAGRIPQFFLADGFIKYRLVDKNGVTQSARDGVLVIGPSSGSGGGGGVDPTTLIQTGMLALFYGTGAISGYVRGNGRTIGSATSGATERANVDTQALFTFLWNADANLTVSGGRGASAAADFTANKQLTLPDLRGRVIGGLDDMGNTAAGRLTAGNFGTSPIVLGAAGGGESVALSLAQLPTGIVSANAAQAITVALAAGKQGVQSNGPVVRGTAFGNGGALDSWVPYTGSGGPDPFTGFTQMTGNNNVSVTSNNTSGATHPSVQPTLLTTIYLKL